MSDIALLPLFLFCLAATGTPGPNNLINLAQGVRVGFWRAAPFAIGAGVGLASMLALAGLGLTAAFTAYPALHWIMRALSGGFVLYLAWRLVRAGPISEADEGERVGFWGGAAFQWINPKSWFATLAIATTYLPTDAGLDAALLAGGVLGVTSQLTQPLWILFGTALRRFLGDPRRAKAVYWAMALLLIGSMAPVLFGVA